MEESIIIVGLTVLSSVVTISRFIYEYRHKCSWCIRKQSDVVEASALSEDTIAVQSD